MTDDIEVTAAYAAAADKYIELFGSVQRVHADDLSLVRRHLGIATGSVVDLGCGPGHLTGYLHTLGVRVTGVDMAPEFIRHARATYPGVRFELGAFDSLGKHFHDLNGILAWYSLIHEPPTSVDHRLAALRAAMAPGGKLIVGFFDGVEVAPFDHKVITAYAWPIDEYACRLTRAGFIEVERTQREAEGATRAHAALVARAV